MFTIVDDWYLSSSFNSRKWKKEKMAKKNRKMGYSLQCCLFLEFEMFCVNDLSLELSVEQVNGKKKDTGKEEFAVWQWQTINKTCYVTTHRQSVVTFSFFFLTVALQSESSSLYWRENSVRLVSSSVRFSAVGPSAAALQKPVTFFSFFLFLGRAQGRNFSHLVDWLFFLREPSIFIYWNVFLLLREILFCFVTK